jgi:hypothetical protein
VFVTVNPKWIAPEVLRGADLLLAFGAAAPGVAAEFAREAGHGIPDVPNRAPDEGLLWSLRAPGGCCAVEIGSPRQDHERHRGKYALGDVGDAHNFYFRDDGAHGTRRARNLADFIGHARAVPDATWEAHLRAGDFAAWFRDVIRDEELARRAAQAAEDPHLEPNRSRRRIVDAIRERYVIPDRQGC